VYACSIDGGTDSRRFAAYVAAAGDGAPIAGYNPMTSQPVLPTVEALVALEAEARLADVANRVAADAGFAGDAAMHVTVATPGMWTDRLATVVEHRYLGHDPGAVLCWFDDPVETEALDAAFTAETIRFLALLEHGPPATLSSAAAREGRAHALAGRVGRRSDAAADALDVLGDDPGLSTMVSFLHGDDAARAMGFTPLGLAAEEGLDHVTAVAAVTFSRSGTG
jgi:hypothetical protein